MAPDTKTLVRKQFVGGNACLYVGEQLSTTPEGNDYSWVRHHVIKLSADGRTERMEFFPEDQWDAALALFDQLAGPGPTNS